MGREEELATLLSVARAAADGAGQVVEVVGEPGMGKSRLLAELQATADVDVLRMDGDVYGGVRRYAPFERVLRDRWEVPATTRRRSSRLGRRGSSRSEPPTCRRGCR